MWKEARGLDGDTILRIKAALTEYLHTVDGCFGPITAPRHLDTYVQGHVRDLTRKSIEPMGDAAGTPPRDLQEVLSLYRWDEAAMQHRCHERVAHRHAHLHSLGILDETGFVKKGDKTGGVQRQYGGAAGKTEACVISVQLGCAMPDCRPAAQGPPTVSHCLLVARSVREPEPTKYFVSKAPEDTPVETLLLVAFSRWKIERMFEDGKGE